MIRPTERFEEFVDATHDVWFDLDHALQDGEDPEAVRGAAEETARRLHALLFAYWTGDRLPGAASVVVLQ
jgi:hypothetical protein